MLVYQRVTEKQKSSPNLRKPPCSLCGRPWRFTVWHKIQSNVWMMKGFLPSQWYVPVSTLLPVSKVLSFSPPQRSWFPSRIPGKLSHFEGFLRAKCFPTVKAPAQGCKKQIKKIKSRRQTHTPGKNTCDRTLQICIKHAMRFSQWYVPVFFFPSPEVPERNPWNFFPRRSRRGTLETLLLVFSLRRLSSSIVFQWGSLRQTLDLSKTTNEKVPWRRPSIQSWDHPSQIPSGNSTVCYWKWPLISLIYLLIMVCFSSSQTVNLPEGISQEIPWKIPWNFLWSHHKNSLKSPYYRLNRTSQLHRCTAANLDPRPRQHPPCAARTSRSCPG